MPNINSSSDIDLLVPISEFDFHEIPTILSKILFSNLDLKLADLALSTINFSFFDVLKLFKEGLRNLGNEPIGI